MFKMYLNLLLEGYRNHQKYFADYLKREQKKAENEFIEADEFFGRCIDVIEALKENLQQQVYKRKHELLILKNLAKAGKEPHNFKGDQKTLEQKNKETIKYCQSELKTIEKENFTVHLNSISKGKFIGHLYYKDILYIEEQVRLVALEIQSEKLNQDKENTKTNPTPLTDLSDTMGTEKIIYLHQLGILEYLRNLEPFVNSTNSLATVISGITGIPVQTAQSYLNPIYSQSTEQKNNPLKNQKKVESIKQSLINLGFKPPK